MPLNILTRTLLTRSKLWEEMEDQEIYALFIVLTCDTNGASH